ncbi:MAG: sulfite exporter TauE/SafE family protein [Holosporales bacterium]|nr:sulfite exporter TauE/SafE family protein [Holosporales bacterium]
MIESFFQIVNLFFDLVLVFSTGLFGGFIAGFLGIGCGVVITPILMDFGVPLLTAIATQLCHAVGTNLTSFLTYKRKYAVDFHLAFYMLFGGMIGAVCEWMILKNCSTPKAAFNKYIYVYITVLIVVGVTMLCQSANEWNKNSVKKYHKNILMRRWMLYLPFHRIFIRSRAEMSILIPILVGFFAELMAASLGGGSNLFMVPIMTYLIGRISPVVNGTVALAGCFIAAVTAIVYSLKGYYCNIFFVLLLFAGAAFGSWIGVKLTYKFKRCQIYLITSVVVFLMVFRQILKLTKYSFFTNVINIEFSSLECVLYSFVKGRPIVYAIFCILLVASMAYFYEKYLQRMYEIKKYAGLRRRKNG